jgi:hypothetical protein
MLRGNFIPMAMLSATQNVVVIVSYRTLNNFGSADIIIFT